MDLSMNTCIVAALPKTQWQSHWWYPAFKNDSGVDFDSGAYAELWTEVSCAVLDCVCTGSTSTEYTLDPIRLDPLAHHFPGTSISLWISICCLPVWSPSSFSRRSVTSQESVKGGGNSDDGKLEFWEFEPGGTIGTDATCRLSSFEN